MITIKQGKQVYWHFVCPLCGQEFVADQYESEMRDEDTRITSCPSCGALSVSDARLTGKFELVEDDEK